MGAAPEYYSNIDDPKAFPIQQAPGTLYGSQRYDAFGRALQTFDLDGTVTLQTKYHAQSKDLYDAADLETGPHQDTFATEVTDGHGRVIRATERTKVSGQIEQHHIKTVYSPLGAPEIITRHKGTPTGTDSSDVTRWMRYDSLGRLVINVDPHTTDGYQSPPALSVAPGDLQMPVGSEAHMHAWRYAYNDAGDLVGTSDARGCGTNFAYDGLGRLLGEDYSPCEGTHADYSDPDQGSPTFAPTLDNWEVAYGYDRPPSGIFLPSSMASADPNFWIGRLVAVADRGALSVTEYDGRGRVIKTARKIAKPAAPGQTPNVLGDRYAPRWYIAATAYDAADRPAYTSAGLHSAELQGGSVTNSPIPRGTLDPDFIHSTIVSHYTARGTLRSVDGSYGTLLSGIQRRADGLVESVTYGDLAATTTATGYDGRRRPTSIQTYRSAPDAWTTYAGGSSGGVTYQPAPAPGGTPTTFQLLLQDLDITYDVVGNPTEIRDWRDPAEWPVGAKPVTRKIAYDDLYRVRQIKFEYSDADASWVSPFAKENNETGQLTTRDHRRGMPSPQVSFDKRVLEQDIAHDWLGNTATTDDDEHGFYDRSLGKIQSVSGKPYQLASAKNDTYGGKRTGHLETKYDVAGNLTDLAVTRSPQQPAVCLPSGANCSQRFHYQWDEVGRLVRAQRWDMAQPNAGTDPPATEPAVDLTYAYDASDNRVLKTATAREGASGIKHRHSVYISGGQELRGAQFGTAYLDSGTSDPDGDYQVDSTTEVGYLFAHGVRLARVAYDNGTGNTEMPVFSGGGLQAQQHVLISLDDTLGSTALVIDQGTGELVEATTYLAHGATESDYRPERWQGLREDYRFTGKEEDVEVGLQYFGRRFLSPYLGRWVSADPLAIQIPGKADLNAYTYVSGAVLKAVDPLGLTDPKGEQGGASSTSNSAEAEGTSSTQSYSTGQPSAGDLSVDAVCGTSPQGAMACALMTCPGDSVQKNMNPADVEVRAKMGTSSMLFAATVGVAKGAGAVKEGLSTAPRAMPKPATEVPVAAPVAAEARTIASRAPSMTSATTGNASAGSKTLEEIANGLEQPAAEDGAVLYRGVHDQHPGYPSALKGEAHPRGGHADPALHNAGNTESVFTSWTTDRSIAVEAAADENGVVLEKWFAKSSHVESPDNYLEKEVLIRDSVTGAKVTKP